MGEDSRNCVRSLRLAGVIARTNELTATWTPSTIFQSHRGSQIDTDDIRNRGQPSQHIGKLGRLLVVCAFPQGSRQFTHLFHQPHERAIHAPGHVLLKVHVANELLEVLQR